MSRPRNYTKKNLGVTIQKTKEIVERHAKAREWSLSKAAEDLIAAGAIVKGITAANSIPEQPVR